MKVCNLIVLFFLFGCANLQQDIEGMHYRKVLKDGEMELNGSGVRNIKPNNFKYYHSFEERKKIVQETYANEYVKSDFKTYIPNGKKKSIGSAHHCHTSFLFIPLHFKKMTDWDVYKKTFDNLENIGIKNTVAIVDGGIGYQKTFGLGFIISCKTLSGITVTKEQLEELEQQGAIYDE